MYKFYEWKYPSTQTPMITHQQRRSFLYLFYIVAQTQFQHLNTPYRLMLFLLTHYSSTIFYLRMEIILARLAFLYTICVLRRALLCKTLHRMRWLSEQHISVRFLVMNNQRELRGPLAEWKRSIYSLYSLTISV